jgi:metal-dependent amidase/aminoacylase/carboxypeptidase family protein
MTSTTTVAVQYIGRRPTFRDHLFGTGLNFEQGQTRELPPEVARKFLRHADQFAEAAAEQAAAKPKGKAAEKGPVDDTDPDGTKAALEQAAKQKDQLDDKERQRQDLMDTIAHMPKAGLIEFARNNYRQELDKSLKVDALREQVRSFVDQFGMVG